MRLPIQMLLNAEGLPSNLEVPKIDAGAEANLGPLIRKAIPLLCLYVPLERLSNPLGVNRSGGSNGQYGLGNACPHLHDRWGCQLGRRWGLRIALVGLDRDLASFQSGLNLEAVEAYLFKAKLDAVLGLSLGLAAMVQEVGAALRLTLFGRRGNVAIDEGTELLVGVRTGTDGKGGCLLLGRGCYHRQTK